MNKHKMHVKRLIKTMLNQSHKQSGKWIIIKIKFYTKNQLGIFFFLKEFQPMTSAPDDNSLLLSDHDTNQFFGVDGIEP